MVLVRRGSKTVSEVSSRFSLSEVSVVLVLSSLLVVSRW
jgi:hypothetical protein